MSSTTSSVTGLGSFSLRLIRARFQTRQGETLLYGAAILAAVICSAMAFIITAGTWMFVQRAGHPTGILAELNQDPTFHLILQFYVGLAAFACALLVPSIVSLTAAGVQLGARGRERRLASLRLLGLSAGDVTRMALIDALIQSLIGTAIGFVLYIVTVPLWHHLSFQAVRIEAKEMLPPWWLLLSVTATLITLSMLAATWGLRQVQISPLGVSRRANAPRARLWRVVIFVAIVGITVILVTSTNLGRSSTPLFILAGAAGLLILGINILGPWLLQALAGGAAHCGSTAFRVAARRIQAAPGATWRRTSTLAVLAFIGGFLAVMPFSYDPQASATATERTFMEMSQYDFTHGAVITLLVGFVLTATSLLITQASATIERAEQSRALHRIGAPRGFGLHVMWLETFVPLVSSTLLGCALGAALGWPLHKKTMAMGLPDTSDPEQVVIVMLAGLAIAALALIASHPLQRRLLSIDERRND